MGDGLPTTGLTYHPFSPHSPDQRVRMEEHFAGFVPTPCGICCESFKTENHEVGFPHFD